MDVDIKWLEFGQEGHVKIGGHDMSRQVQGVEVRAWIGEVPTVTVHTISRNGVEVEVGDAQVTVIKRYLAPWPFSGLIRYMRESWRKRMLHG